MTYDNSITDDIRKTKIDSIILEIRSTIQLLGETLNQYSQTQFDKEYYRIILCSFLCRGQITSFCIIRNCPCDIQSNRRPIRTMY